MSQATAGTLDITFKAGEALTDKQYCFVKLDEKGNVVASTSSKSVSIGILQNAPAINRAARVRLLGTSKLVAGEAFSVGGTFRGLVGGIEGTLITSDTDGRGVVADYTDFIGAIVLEAAAAPLGINYEVIEAIITHMYAPAGA